jgi:hypothetical protein
LSGHFAAIPSPARKWSDNHRSVVLRQVPFLNVLLNSSSLFILPLAVCTNNTTFISFTKILINSTSSLMEIGHCNVRRPRSVELRSFQKSSKRHLEKKKVSSSDNNSGLQTGSSSCESRAGDHFTGSDAV